MSESNEFAFPDFKNSETCKSLALAMSNILASAAAHEIKNDAQLVQAGEYMQAIQDMLKTVDTERKRITKPIDVFKKQVIAFFREQHSDKLESTLNGLKRMTLTYRRVQEQKAREEQARADEKARKERERLDKRAAIAAQSGKAEKAEQLRQQADTVVAPISTPSAPKVSGISERITYGFELDGSPVDPNYMTPDLKKIGAVVRASKGEIVIPGVRVIKQSSLAVAS